jgi:hypothetical protein
MYHVKCYRGTIPANRLRLIEMDWWRWPQERPELALSGRVLRALRARETSPSAKAQL